MELEHWIYARIQKKWRGGVIWGLYRVSGDGVGWGGVVCWTPGHPRIRNYYEIIFKRRDSKLIEILKKIGSGSTAQFKKILLLTNKNKQRFKIS